jgi:hypothetical protein
LRTLWFLVALGVAAIHLVDHEYEKAHQQPSAT